MARDLKQHIALSGALTTQNNGTLPKPIPRNCSKLDFIRVRMQHSVEGPRESVQLTLDIRLQHGDDFGLHFSDPDHSHAEYGGPLASGLFCYCYRVNNALRSRCLDNHILPTGRRMRERKTCFQLATTTLVSSSLRLRLVQHFGYQTSGRKLRQDTRPVSPGLLSPAQLG